MDLGELERSATLLRQPPPTTETVINFAPVPVHIELGRATVTAKEPGDVDQHLVKLTIQTESTKLVVYIVPDLADETAAGLVQLARIQRQQAAT